MIMEDDKSLRYPGMSFVDWFRNKERSKYARYTQNVDFIKKLECIQKIK